MTTRCRDLFNCPQGGRIKVSVRFSSRGNAVREPYVCCNLVSDLEAEYLPAKPVDVEAALVNAKSENAGKDPKKEGKLTAAGQPAVAGLDMSFSESFSKMIQYANKVALRSRLGGKGIRYWC
eukprot:1394917-Amorphochlora_amoeboformis.AAC.1